MDLLLGALLLVSLVAAAPALVWFRDNARLAALLGIFAACAVVVLAWRRAARRRAAAATLEGLLACSPAEFEEAVARILRTAGFREVEPVGGSGDLSIDLVGRDGEGRPVVVQCKRYAPGRRVGSPDIQRFHGMARLRSPEARAIFATTSDFTDPARDVAELTGVELLEGADLVALAQGRTRDEAGDQGDAPDSGGPGGRGDSVDPDRPGADGRAVPPLGSTRA